IREGYSAGRFGQLDVLDAQRSYNETRTQYVKALADYHKAQAQIDALTAVPVELPSPTEPVSKTYGNRNKKAPRNEWTTALNSIADWNCAVRRLANSGGAAPSSALGDRRKGAKFQPARQRQGR